MSYSSSININRRFVDNSTSVGGSRSSSVTRLSTVMTTTTVTRPANGHVMGDDDDDTRGADGGENVDMCNCGFMTTTAMDIQALMAAEKDVADLEKVVREHEDEVRTLKSIIDAAGADRQKRETAAAKENADIARRVEGVRAMRAELSRELEVVRSRQAQCQQQVDNPTVMCSDKDVAALERTVRELKRELGTHARRSAGRESPTTTTHPNPTLVSEQVQALMYQHGFTSLQQVPSVEEARARLAQAKLAKRTALNALAEVKDAAVEATRRGSGTIRSNSAKRKPSSSSRHSSPMGRSASVNSVHSAAGDSSDVVLTLRLKLRALQRSLQVDGDRERLIHQIDEARQEASETDEAARDLAERAGIETRARSDARDMCRHFLDRFAEMRGDLNLDRSNVLAGITEVCEKPTHGAALRDLLASCDTYEHVIDKCMAALEGASAETTASRRSAGSPTLSSTAADKQRHAQLTKVVGNLKMRLFDLKGENAGLLRSQQMRSKSQHRASGSPARPARRSQRHVTLS